MYRCVGGKGPVGGEEVSLSFGYSRRQRTTVQVVSKQSKVQCWKDINICDPSLLPCLDHFCVLILFFSVFALLLIAWTLICYSHFTQEWCKYYEKLRCSNFMFHLAFDFFFPFISHYLHTLLSCITCMSNAFMNQCSMKFA